MFSFSDGLYDGAECGAPSQVHAQARALIVHLQVVPGAAEGVAFSARARQTRSVEERVAGRPESTSSRRIFSRPERSQHYVFACSSYDLPFQVLSRAIHSFSLALEAFKGRVGETVSSVEPTSRSSRFRSAALVRRRRGVARIQRAIGLQSFLHNSMLSKHAHR